MALVYAGIIRKEVDMAGKHRVLTNLTDEVREFKFQSDPTNEQVEAVANQYIAQQNIEAEYDDNELNLTIDQEYVLEWLLRIKTEIVLGIRQYPNATVAQFQTYMDAKYPIATTIINYRELVTKFMAYTHLDIWAEFKTYVINHKFRGID